MNTIYKLTSPTMTTRNNTQWVLGEWHETSGEGGICGNGWLHTFTDPLLAVFLAPIYFDEPGMRLFRGEGEGAYIDDDGLKVGYSRIRIVEEIPLPTVDPAQRIAFGILCAKTVCTDTKWNKWADAWLSGSDRSTAAANAAWAAYSTWTAYAAYAAYAAWAAAWAARAAAYSAAYSAEAAEAAAWAKVELDLIAIAKQAMTYK